MSELDDIYSDEILTLAANMPPAERLPDPDASATAHSKLCGSTITVDLEVRDGLVSAYGHTVKACLLGQTSAAVVAREAKGSTPQELRDVARQMRAMLKEDGEPPTGRWADLALLRPVRHFKARHTSTLLVFDAVLEALDEIERRAGSAA
ncbi:MAG: iron-sulfur cluster assembly scaffold protein [Rhizobiales bacterium]|nr:iron-sulfur cluster assembly scaffold protein [Hyphomicrobiales bacterium]